MRNYFLLEAGDTMYDFYTAIFDKVQEKESWQQLSFLNVQLQEAVGQRYPEDSSRYCMPLLVRIKLRMWYEISLDYLNSPDCNVIAFTGCQSFWRQSTPLGKNTQ